LSYLEIKVDQTLSLPPAFPSLSQDGAWGLPKVAVNSKSFGSFPKWMGMKLIDEKGRNGEKLPVRSSKRT